VLAAHGTPEQRARWLRPMFTMEEIWCQLFSEPGAGSDVAGLATRAVRDGDEWVVNGQKVWTTLAHLAKWGLLVTRTDPDQPKHRGMTYFIVDMEADGVDVRPLYQITGEAEFNEVFFSDTRIPAAEMLGSPGDGWRVSLTTLMNERVSIGGTMPAKGSGTISALVQAWNQLPADRRNPVARDAVMKLWARAEVLRLTNIRANQMRKAGDPGPEGSIGKMTNQGLMVTAATIHMALLGAEGLARAAAASHANTRQLVDALTSVDGIERIFEGPFFHECALRSTAPVADIMRSLAAHNVLGGYDLGPEYPALGQAFLVCATEKHSADDIAHYAEKLERIMGLRKQAACPVQPNFD